MRIFSATEVAIFICCAFLIIYPSSVYSRARGDYSCYCEAAAGSLQDTRGSAACRESSSIGEEEQAHDRNTKKPDPIKGILVDENSPLSYRGMFFKKDVVLGDALEVDCTKRCHIDFPFRTDRPFRHDVHSPKQGFGCRLCHVSDNVGQSDHGRLRLPEGGCKSCHHNKSKYPKCDICHEPVIKSFKIGRLVFDHNKHVNDRVKCSRCHGDANINDSSWDMDRCLSCHHADPFPVPCIRCHDEVKKRTFATKFKGFDHRIHASVMVGKKNNGVCRLCHLNARKAALVSKPEKLQCDSCHHPVSNVSMFECRHCHSEEVISRRINNGYFNHALHAQALGSCRSCHANNPSRSPEMGRRCAHCHHEKPDDCKRCHEEPLNFVRLFKGSDGSMAFSHSVHERNISCMSCHEPGNRFSAKAMTTKDCAECHHNSGHFPTCSDCHGDIDRTRKGNGPSGMNGHSEPMEGIVECIECHEVQVGEIDGIAKGSKSCKKCHPQEYEELLKARMKSLARIIGKNRLLGKNDSPRLTVPIGIHNFNLATDVLREGIKENQTMNKYTQ